MTDRLAQLMAIAVAVVMGAWVAWATVAIVELAGGGPPATVAIAVVVAPLATALVYALLHDGPRAAPLWLRVRDRDRRGRR